MGDSTTHCNDCGQSHGIAGMCPRTPPTTGAVEESSKLLAEAAGSLFAIGLRWMADDAEARKKVLGLSERIIDHLNARAAAPAAPPAEESPTTTWKDLCVRAETNTSEALKLIAELRSQLAAARRTAIEQAAKAQCRGCRLGWMFEDAENQTPQFHLYPPEILATDSRGGLWCEALPIRALLSREGA